MRYYILLFIRYISIYIYPILCTKTSWQVTSVAVHRLGGADSGSSLASSSRQPVSHHRPSQEPVPRQQMVVLLVATLGTALLTPAEAVGNSGLWRKTCAC